MPNNMKIISKENKKAWKIFMDFGIYQKFCNDERTSIYVDEQQFALAYLIEQNDFHEQLLKEWKETLGLKNKECSVDWIKNHENVGTRIAEEMLKVDKVMQVSDGDMQMAVTIFKTAWDTIKRIEKETRPA